MSNDQGPTVSHEKSRSDETQHRRQVAIALDHGRTDRNPPRVIAKGYGELAEKILRLAFENDVKVRTDPELAQVLSVVEVDCDIPLEAFAAVAEILSYVYAENRRMLEIGIEAEPIE